MAKMKELNIVLEKTLEKANQKKLAKISKEGSANVKIDAKHILQVKQGELRNA